MDAFTQVLSALSNRNVRFIVVGGVAVNAHGFQRFTQDLDLALDLSKENVEVALEVFEGLGFRPRVPVQMADFLNLELRKKWISEKGMKVFTLISDRLNGLIVDIFAEDPFPFAETLAKSFTDDLGADAAITIPFLDLESLIAMKIESGRPNDLRDVEELRLLQHEITKRQS